MDEDIMASIHKIWAKLASPEPDLGGLLENAMNVGALNAQILGLLDDAHATKFGIPEPTQVCLSATEGKCILISGHDMGDLKALLEQTEGTGVNVYTHGEMLRPILIPNSRNTSIWLEIMEQLGKIKSLNSQAFQDLS